MQRPVACLGTCFSVVYAVCEDETSPGLEFYQELGTTNRAKMAALFNRFAEQGKIINKEKFKRIEDSEFFEFKSHQIRMPCYFLPGKLLVITHGFIKKGDRISKEELARAIRIRNEDAAKFAKSGGRQAWTN